ncbi:PREDICTED: uncharacterized protein LOC106815081 [Priapulus caudatus]|uniref:Uncharacterized protein LOC106815081 n=1 Tax=Priapulus caudatus TaxID=37621 RepID=A0ABM1ES21_PRICU|nr:PREDICTED: uncharacterized protein LOC106815081 [Priapulus caudatus]
MLIAVVIAHSPFFSCLSSPYHLIGYSIGCAYSIMWLVIKLVQFFSLEACSPQAAYVGMLDGVVIAGYSFIFIRFLVLLFLEIKEGNRDLLERDKSAETMITSDHHALYVRALLLKRKLPTDTSTGPDRFWLEMYKNIYLYRSHPGFKYSTRMIASMLLAFLIVYWTSILVFFGARTVTENIEDSDMKSAVKICWYISAVLATLIISYSIMATVAFYRRDLLNAFRGNWDFLPRYYDPQAHHLLARASRFPGYQAAYLIIGKCTFTPSTIRMSSMTPQLPITRYEKAQKGCCC